MNQIKLSIFLFLCLVKIVINKDTALNEDTALQYLEKFGYSPENKSGPQKIIDKKKAFIDYLKQFQMIHGLNITGKLDEQTIKKMNSPRCSLPDQFNEKRIASFKTATKWSKKTLTFKVSNENEELRGQTRKIIADAFKYWSDVSSLKFSEVNPNSKADLSIKFARRYHGDNFPFDGPSGVLAHAFFPEMGEIHFDEDETFTMNKRGGTDLKMVAVHEFGHALGLEHSLAAQSIMNPYYQGYEDNFKLGRDDIDGIRFLYGANYNPVQTTIKPTTKITTTTKKNQKQTTKSYLTNKLTTKQTSISTSASSFLPCSSRKQSVFIGPDKNMYTLLEYGYGLHKFDFNSKKWTKSELKNIYKELPKSARGGALDNKGTSWFFNDRDIYAYNGNKLVNGYPKTIMDSFYPRHPYTGIFKNNKLYVFKTYLFEIDLSSLRVVNYYYSQSIFPGLDFHFDASLKYNGFIYFFFENKYYKFDEKQNKMLTGFPKSSLGNWFPC